MAQRLVVEIIGDASKLNRTFRETSRDAKRFEATMTRTGRSFSRTFAATAGPAAATAGLAVGFKSAVSAASDLSEQMSKNQQVFGRSAREIETWSQTTAEAFGISRRQALATASSFGALFAPMGLVGTQAAEQSRKLTELGADLASFYNTDVQDALDAIRSGIVGESEPLRRYGVLLSETRVQAAALAQTHKQSATDLTAAEKALARITLIMRDTSKAQGDFARTSEGLANQSRQLRAEWDDLKTTAGQAWTPGATKIVHALNQEMKVLLDTSKELADAAPTDAVRASLVPKLAADFGRLKQEGLSTSEAMHQLRRNLGDTAKAADLVGEAIRYFADNKAVSDIVKLRQEIRGVGVDAETAAKQMHGLAAATAAVAVEAAEAAAAAPRGLAALTPGARAGLDLAAAGLTPGVADNLAALQRQHQLDVGAAAFARGRLAGASGPAAARWAENLRRVLERDASTLAQISSIQADIDQKAQDARDKARAAREKANREFWEGRRLAQRQAQRKTERRMGWLEFAVERAEATESVPKIRRALQAEAKFLRELIKSEGRKLEWVRELWRINDKIKNLNKSKADPLAGLQQVSSRRLANMLAAGTGLGPAGLRALSANIAGAEIQPVYVSVQVDGREIGHAVRKDNSRTAHRTSRQTSGYRG